MKLTVKYFSNSVNITSWELRTDACFMQYGSKSYKVDDHGVIYYLTIYYLQLILLGSFAFSKIQVSVYIS